MKKNRFLIISLIVLFTLPGAYLFVKKYQSRKKSLVLVVNQSRDFVNRYSFEDDKDKIDFNEIEKSKEFLSATKITKNKTLEEYFENVLKTYQILDGQVASESLGRETTNQIQQTIDLDKQQTTVIGQGEKFQLLSKFDRPIGNKSPSQSNALRKWDGDNTQPVVEVEDIKGQYFDKFYNRSLDSLNVEVPKLFLKSPIPKTTKNAFSELQQLQINLDKKNYYLFELIKMNLIYYK